MDLRIRLIEALSYLGSAADEIAASLKDKGIKGVWSDPYDCPISVYLALCGVQVNYFELLSPNCDAEEMFEPPDLQEALEEFVAAFDTPCYPELELAA